MKNTCLFEEHIDPPGKLMSVRRTDGPSWKIHVCSRNKWTLLENYKKVAPGKKEQIFSKTVSVAASVNMDKNHEAQKYFGDFYKKGVCDDTMIIRLFASCSGKVRT